MYIVGTGEYWECTINETVEFRILGKQPDYYTEGCSIESFSEGKSYVWKWEYLGLPSVQKVGIRYEFDDNFGLIMTGIWVGISLAIILVVTVPMIIMLKIKKRKSV